MTFGEMCVAGVLCYGYIGFFGEEGEKKGEQLSGSCKLFTSHQLIQIIYIFVPIRKHVISSQFTFLTAREVATLSIHIFFLLKLVTGDVLVSWFKKPFRFIENRGIMVNFGSSLLLDRTKFVKIFGEKGSFGMVILYGLGC